MKDCYNCEYYQLEGKVTSGKGKKSISKSVISYCKISEHKNGLHYCWLTTWESGYVVSVRTRKKTQSQKVHSFHVYKRN